MGHLATSGDISGLFWTFLLQGGWGCSWWPVGRGLRRIVLTRHSWGWEVGCYKLGQKGTVPTAKRARGGGRRHEAGLGGCKITWGLFIWREQHDCYSKCNGNLLEGLDQRNAVFWRAFTKTTTETHLAASLLSGSLCLALLPAPTSFGPLFLPSAAPGTKCHPVKCFVKRRLSFMQADNATEMTPFSFPFHKKHSRLRTVFLFAGQSSAEF